MRIIGKITGMNTSDGLINLNVTDDKQNQYNIKTNPQSGYELMNGRIYVFGAASFSAEQKHTK